MSSSAFGCIVCGIPIFSYESRYVKPWLSEYRAIYRKNSQAESTGVGRYDGTATWSPPRNLSERWDNEHYSTIKLTASKEPLDDGYRGFFIHDSCWSLLQKSFEPSTIPLERLLEVCESLPSPPRTSSLSWGHDFGGLWTIDKCNAFPWQEDFFQPRQPLTIFLDGLENPYDVRCIPNMLSTQIQPPFTEPLIKPSQDCFVSLPWEILEKIAVLLNTEDALNLRLASASFVPLYISECFWASRFSADSERGFLFEAQKPQGYLYWITLYRLSTIQRRPPELRNRQRIWGLTRIIVDIAKQHLAESPLDITEEDQAESSLAWVSCDVYPKFKNEPWLKFPGGCRSFGTCIVPVPKDLLQIGISIIETGACTYVTGIRFISRHSHTTKIGYVAEQNEQLFIISGLHGFNIALSKSGIRALQLVHNTGFCSQWAGNPTEMLLSNDLQKDEPIERLAVSYDGFKLVGLAIDLQWHEKTPVIKANESLKQTAWYPHLPPDRAYFNANSVFYPQISHTRFQPFILLDFGGPEGKYLQYIMGVCFQYRHGLHSIEFRYVENPYTGTSKKLGCCDVLEVPQSALFEINGMSGERITTIDIAVQAQTEERDWPEALNGIRLSTNLDRAYEVGDLNTDTGVTRLNLAEETAIVGLYAHQEPEIGLYGLGLISIAIEEWGWDKQSL